MPNAGILVDTSVWIRFFRHANAVESIHLDALLEMRAVRTCESIRAEVLSGSRTEQERSHLGELFLAVPILELPSNIWRRVEEARFRLARRGHQTSLIDLVIAHTATFHQTPLWTLDQDFERIRESLPFSRYLPGQTP